MPSVRTLAGLIVLSVSLGLSGCGDKAATSADAEARDDPKAEAGPSAPADAAPAEVPSEDAGQGEGGEPEPEAGEDAGDEAADAAADATGTQAEGDDGEAAAEAGAAEASAGEEPAADPKALLDEAKKKKTSDERAMEALTEAEAAGAKPLELAKAANARGEALHADPERAAKFYQWAADKDPKYPVPVFNLAKQAAVKGEVDEVKKHLTEVKARGGKKLLGQIEFDPMWEIVKDDPAVRALLEG